jgi:hypothetical protein
MGKAASSPASPSAQAGAYPSIIPASVVSNPSPIVSRSATSTLALSLIAAPALGKRHATDLATIAGQGGALYGPRRVGDNIAQQRQHAGLAVAPIRTGRVEPEGRPIDVGGHLEAAAGQIARRLGAGDRHCFGPEIEGDNPVSFSTSAIA